MPEPIQSVVVLGGGLAVSVTATTLTTRLPELNVSIIHAQAMSMETHSTSSTNPALSGPRQPPIRNQRRFDQLRWGWQHAAVGL